MSPQQIKLREIDYDRLSGTFEQIQEFLQELKLEYPEAVGIDYEMYSSSYGETSKTFYLYRLETGEEFSARLEEHKQRLVQKEVDKQQKAKAQLFAAAKDLGITEESLKELLK
jgi:pyruvate carboxylase